MEKGVAFVRVTGPRVLVRNRYVASGASVARIVRKRMQIQAVNMSDQDTATLPETGLPQSSRVLDPVERSSEIMFGLIMALTFTSSVSVASSTRNDVATMLASALSCNVAWGLIDAAMSVSYTHLTLPTNREV